MPSSEQARKDLDRANTAVVSAEKDLYSREEKANKIEAAILKLQQQAMKASSASSASSYTRQAQTKQRELERARRDVNSYRQRLLDKQKIVTQKYGVLERALKEEQKKAQREQEKITKQDKKYREEQSKHFKAQEASLSRQVSQRRSLTAEVQRTNASFSARVAASDWEADRKAPTSEYELNELQRVSERIDNVLGELNKLGLGQSILFDEIEEMKDKSRKLSRKDFKMILLGKLMAFGSAATGLEADDIGKIWQDITEMPLPAIG